MLVRHFGFGPPWMRSPVGPLKLRVERARGEWRDDGGGVVLLDVSCLVKPLTSLQNDVLNEPQHRL